MKMWVKNLNLEKILLLFCANIIVSCSTPIDPVHKKVRLNKHQLPIISIIADSMELFDDTLGIYSKGVGVAENWQGIKANYFSKKKIKIDLAYFVNNKLVLSQICKMNVSGGGSRKQPQKSFNISSKNNFDYPFFKNLTFENYKSLRLRVSGQDWRETHLRDALMHTLVDKTNIDTQAYQPAILYLNGKYWGIYNIREKFNKNYLFQHHGVKNIDALEQNIKIIDGSNTNYIELIEFIKQKELNKKENWKWIEEQVDIENFIDYYCSQIYFANTDWPGNNIKYWKSMNGKWRWFLHDTDLGFAFAPIWGHPGGLNHNTLQFALNDSVTSNHNQAWSTLLFRKFLENKKFKKKFISKFDEHLNITFQSSRVINIIDSLANNIAPEIPKHIDRWKNEADYLFQSIEDWEKELEILRDFSRKRPDIVRSHLKEEFNLKAKK